MANTSKDLVFLLPEQEENLIPEKEGTTKLYNVILFSNDFSEENKIQLENILKAIHIDFATQVQLIALNENQTLRYTEMCPDSGFLFSFGVDPDTLGFNIHSTLYDVSTFSNTKVLFSESLHTIRTQVESKKKLWTCLKSYFLD